MEEDSVLSPSLKQEWRSRQATLRDTLTREERAERSIRLCGIVRDQVLIPLLEERKRPLTICLYGAFRSEADPEQLAEWCRMHGHRTAAPRIRDDRPGMELRIIRVNEDWKKGRWGVPAPDPERTELLASDELVDLVLVPGLAFDKHGGRLGYGGGYYDRLYEELGDNPFIQWIGFAFEMQIVNGYLPRESHDLPLVGLATEEGWTSFKA